MITVPGVGSGLDISSLVSQLVAAEGNAKTFLLASKRADADAEITAFGALKSALSSFKSAIATLKNSATFAGNKLTSSDDEIFTATSTGNVAASVYDIEVVDFAEAHKLLSVGFIDSSSNIGTGKLTIAIGISSFTVTIDSSNQTVTGIRDAINDASNNPGVTATIANVDDGSGGTETKLILTSNNTGVANKLTVTVDDDDLTDTDSTGLSVLYYDTGDATTPEQLTEINAAVDASIKIDGQAVTNASNTIVDAIQGVTFTLLKEDPGNTHTLTIALDKAAVTTSINSFINSYNSLIAGINAAILVDEETGNRGVLLGDRTLLTLSRQIRRELNNSVTGINGNIKNLVELGITTKADGKLELDSTKLDSVLNSDFDAIDDLFTSTDGIATRFDTLLNDYVKSGGIIDDKTTGLNKTIDRIDDDLDALNRSLVKLEQRLLAQFSALDVLLAGLQNTSNFLTTQLAAIAKISDSRK